MDGKKPYAVAVAIQVIYTGLFVVSKAAFDKGVNTYIFIFYRLAAATALLLPLALISACRSRTTTYCTGTGDVVPVAVQALLIRVTRVYVQHERVQHEPQVHLRYGGIGGHQLHARRHLASSSRALLLRMEAIELRSRSGLGKLAGVALCLAGVLVIAFYAGPSIRPLTRHPVFAAHGNKGASAALHVSKGAWIKGTFLMLLACATLSLWIVLQVCLLKEYPNKLMATTIQCLFGTIQSSIVAVVVERDFSKWKLGLDIGLLAVFYSAFLGTGAIMYLQAWCAEMKGPVFVAAWTPLALVFTIFCSSFFLGEAVHLGSILGGLLLVGALYSVLWGKCKENENRITPAADENQKEGTMIEEKHERGTNITCETTSVASTHN